MTADLRRRVLSALVIVPVTLGAVWMGGGLLSAFLAVGAGIIAWEWARICGAGRGRSPAVLLAAITPVAALMALLDELPLAIALACAGMAAAAMSAWRDLGSPPRIAPALLSAAGLLYGGLPMVAFGLLRDRPDYGLTIAIWILLIIWATDVGGYAAGRAIGGPKLAPRISPSKTWAGFAGTVVFSGLTGAGVAAATGLGSMAPLALVSGLLAVFAQLGDLGASMLKRRYGCKDSGRLIPGHGGLMDRLDGFLVVAAAVYLGVAFFGRSTVPWQ